ncbi:ArsR family transcriptional regulator [Actibacterium mucosum KCTC 23349]|uniref:ArsR family transcriptional regulator n=1 Tax=Actibacterium mucosum KCTC 23349 TaxID=1454373 RepID=A0A037ZDK5_9RHOB|nr:metalloregulator ArsR/SmtB family transcription factor [Actibacterium mucosum]KAJ54222.1 ArsR family transcriptional regulator [Actibacterium mucosum KCTC 23349]
MTYESVLLALSDPTRRKVFETVAAKPCAVGAIADQLPVSRPAVSQHLKVLSDAGLVHVTVQGTRRIYAARPEGLAELRAYLDRLWGDVLTEFAKEIEKDNPA